MVVNVKIVSPAALAIGRLVVRSGNSIISSTNNLARKIDVSKQALGHLQLVQQQLDIGDTTSQTRRGRRTIFTSSFSNNDVYESNHSNDKHISADTINHKSISSSNNNKSENSSNKSIRLSKRMSELNLCSRREADKLISEQNRVMVNGIFINQLGTKVDALETNIQIIILNNSRNNNSISNGNIDPNIDNNLDNNSSNGSNNFINCDNVFDWDKIRGDTVVLHKPADYVSGQPDPKHGHVPAVRLLTRKNMYFPEKNYDADANNDNKKDTNIDDNEFEELKYTLSSGKYLHFARKRKVQRNTRRENGKFEDEEITKSNNHNHFNNNKSSNDTTTTATTIATESTVAFDFPSTLLNYAPAGRLDLNSTGVLIFTKNGVIAKQILSANTDIEKEYIVQVEPVVNITRHERNMGLKALPFPPVWDLSALTKGGRRLWNDRAPLKPLEAEWIDEGKKKKNNGKGNDGDSGGEWDGTGTIRMVLKEGRKRQIRRMCREFLGLNVITLKRVRVGSIDLGALPVGQWRTLTQREVMELLKGIN